MQVTPQQEHHWLERMAGDWTFTTECSMGPDQPPMKSEGTDTTVSLGGLWVVSEWKSPGPDGTPMTSRMTIGYDPARGKYVGSFVASCMTHQWVYEGTLDAGGTVLTLDTEGPSFTDPTAKAKYQDIIELHGDDKRVLRSRFQTDDGNWHDFMRAEYRRAA
jgi:hypothetical protein